MYRFDPVNHIHTWNGKPLIGTTTALSVIEKPLTWWSSGMCAGEFGWINPKKNPPEEVEKAARAGFTKVRGMSFEQYRAHLNRAYRAHHDKKEKRASEGTDLHTLVENYVKAKIAGQGHIVPKQLAVFDAWCKENVKRFLWSEIHCYDDALWVGGISDFGYEDVKDRIVLADIKSSKAAYFSHWVQAGGYDIQISKNGGLTKDGQILFKLDKPINYYAIFPFGNGTGKPELRHNTDDFKVAFANALQLYKIRSKVEDNG